MPRTWGCCHRSTTFAGLCAGWRCCRSVPWITKGSQSTKILKKTPSPCLNLTFPFPLQWIEWNWKDFHTNFWLSLLMMADHYWSCAPPALGLEVFTGLPLNLCLNLKARKLQTFLLVLLPSLSLPHLLSHSCSKHSPVMSALRMLQRAGSGNREIPVKKKSSYSFSCFAGLFVKLVQFLIPHGWGSQAEGTEQWEAVAVAMLLRERSMKSHLLQALCTWRRFCSRGKWRQHAEVGQLPSKSPEGSHSHCSQGNVLLPWCKAI